MVFLFEIIEGEIKICCGNIGLLKRVRKCQSAGLGLDVGACAEISVIQLKNVISNGEKKNSQMLPEKVKCASKIFCSVYDAKFCKYVFL